MSPEPQNAFPAWARQDAFPAAPEGYGWLDAKAEAHACASDLELRAAIRADRAARVMLIWTPEHPHMVLPEEWRAAADDVGEGRRQRLMDDCAVSRDRIRWYGALLAGAVLYVFYQGWRFTPDSWSAVRQWTTALQAVISSIMVGLCLLMFLIFGFIPWYQARKSLREWKRGGEENAVEWLAALRFETWLGYQRAPATRLVFGLMAVVGLAQLLPGNGIAAAGLMKDPAHAHEWWRTYTAAFLHGNPLHFLMNAAALLYLGRRLEVFARWPHVPLVFLLAAAVGNEASLRFVDKPSVGASGGLLGWLGFLLVFESLHRRLVPRSARRRLLAGVFLTALIGFVGYRFIDNAAHLGGLLAGVLYAAVVFPPSSSPMRPVSTKTDILAGFLAFGALAICAATAAWKIFSVWGS